MSLLLRLTFLLSYFYITLPLLNQSPYYDNFFFYKNSSLIEHYLRQLINKNNNNLSNKLEFRHDFVEKIIKFISQFWLETKFIPVSYLFNDKLYKCYESIRSMDNNTFQMYIEGTGKHLNDLGNEFFCTNHLDNDDTKKENNIKIDSNYYVLQAYIEDINILTNVEDQSLLEFLDQKYFYYGACLSSKCAGIIDVLVKEKSLLDFLYWNLTVSNFTISNYIDTFETFKNERYKGSNIPNFFYIIVGIKFFVGFLMTILLKKGYEGYYLKNSKKGNKNKNVSMTLIDSNKEENNVLEEKEENNNLNENDQKRASNKSLTNIINENYSNSIKERYFEYIYGTSSKTENNLYNPFYDNQDEYPLRIKIIKCIDLIDNLKILIALANKYYNSCNIKKIYFLKFSVMFMSIVLKLMISQIKLPSRNFLVYEFFKSHLFFLIKICAFSTCFWIVLDATTVGFKLMSYIKKKIGSSVNNDLKFIDLLKFLLLLIPKIFLFILCFYIFHLYSNYLTTSLTNKYHIGPFIYYNDTIGISTYDLKYKNDNMNRFSYLIPFYINYIDYFKKDDINNNTNKNIIINGSDDLNPSLAPNYTYYEYEKTGYKVPSPFLTNTELFINVYLNEFILLIFMIMITYLSYKIRNKIFDFCILIINIILYILPVFLTDYNFTDEEKYTLIYVLGQNFSEKYTHYFINFYYFGFIIGVMMFYYNENIFSHYNSINNNNIQRRSSSYSNSSSESNLKINDSYVTSSLLNLLPFSFCNDIIMGLAKLKFYIKRIILLSCVVLIIFISFSFFIIQKYESIINSNNYFKIYIPKINDSIVYKYIFLYEKNICCIFFFIFLLIFIVYPNNNNFVKFSRMNFFIIFDRINFSFYCTYSYFVYAAFCFFYVDLKLSYINVFLHSLGLFMILITINIFIVCVFELPIRIFIKSLMNKQVKKEFRMSFDAGKGLIS